jgi:hypothetical protein
VEASGPQSPDDGERRTGVLLGVLATLVLGGGIALGIVLASDDDGGSDGPAVTATAPATTAAPTTTTVTTTEPAPPTTATQPAPATITQEQAKAAAARGASEEAAKGGIGIPPSDWDVRCTAAGGGPRAVKWTCQAAANSGQCSGTIVAYARAPDVAATTDPRIGCGE